MVKSHSSINPSESTTLMSESHLNSVIGEHWPGYDGLKNLIVFGDSYSAVGYGPDKPLPTTSEPLGVPFPGSTWTDGMGGSRGASTNANWVGHLVMSRIKDSVTLKVYDYAVGGHTLAGVKQQVENRFLPSVGSVEKGDSKLWEPEDTLFITWVGINGCAFHRGEHEGNMKKLFALQETLYESGARNFLLIDVPPIHQSPAFSPALANNPAHTATFAKWNSALRTSAAAFLDSHPSITLLVYSSCTIFDNVNANPAAYGFSERDLRKAGGAIWMDRLHPTSAMHKVIADDLDNFLGAYRVSRMGMREKGEIEAEALEDHP